MIQLALEIIGALAIGVWLEYLLQKKMNKRLAAVKKRKIRRRSSRAPRLRQR